MKKLLCLVFVLIALLGLTFAVSAAEMPEANIVSSSDNSMIYQADGEIPGKGAWNEGATGGGTFWYHWFDGNTDYTKSQSDGGGAAVNNFNKSYLIIDLNKSLGGGYYVTEIKIFHAGNTNYTLSYTTDGVNWVEVASNVKTSGMTSYAIDKKVLQVKYVFESIIQYAGTLAEIQVLGINPADMPCIHSNLSADAWKVVEGTGSCTTVPNESQVCVDCEETVIRKAEKPLGHILHTDVTKPGTNISYGEGTIVCTRNPDDCQYAIDFHGEVDITGDYYLAINDSPKFVNVFVSSIADKWGASAVGNMFNNTWSCGAYNGWFSNCGNCSHQSGQLCDDTKEYVIFDFKGELDLTKIDIMVPNDRNATLLIWAMNEYGEYEIVRELDTYDESLGEMQNSAGFRTTVSMLGVTTTSIKIQVISPSDYVDGYQYFSMIVGECHVYAIAPGCGLDATNHECVYDIFDGYKVAPTCQLVGTAYYKCACNARVESQVDPSEEFHNFIEVEGTRVNSTCTVAGSYTGKCEYCEEEKEIALDLDTEAGHDFVETDRTDATCTVAGSISYECSNCGDTKTEEIPVADHAYGEPTVVPSTCTVAGTSTKVCADCGNEDVTTLDLAEHAYGEAVVVEPECEKDGSSTKICADCGNEDVTTLEAPGHAWEVDSYVEEPTCSENGEADYVCPNCDATKTDVAPATGIHEYDMENIEVVVAPTCQTTGYGTVACEACGITKTVVIDVLAHDFSVEVERKEPTCEETGYIIFKCSNANCPTQPKTETLLALGHDWADATCLAPKTCKRENCGVTEGEKSTEHAWTAASCTAPRTCSVCLTTDGEALGHTYGWNIPVKNEAGEVIKTISHGCSVCYLEAVEDTDEAGNGLGYSTTLGEGLKILYVKNWSELYNALHTKKEVDFDVIRLTDAADMGTGTTAIQIYVPVIVDLGGNTIKSGSGAKWSMFLLHRTVAFGNGKLEHYGQSSQAIKTKNVDKIADLEIEVKATSGTVGGITSSGSYDGKECIGELTNVKIWGSGLTNHGIEAKNNGTTIGKMTNVYIESKGQAMTINNNVSFGEMVDCTFKGGNIALDIGKLYGEYKMTNCTVHGGYITIKIANAESGAKFEVGSDSTFTADNMLFDITDAAKANAELTLLETTVASVNGKLYDKIDNALEALENSKEEVTTFALMANLELKSSIVIDKAVNFSLGGGVYYTIATGSTVREPHYADGYTITIADDTVGNGVFLVMPTGKLTLSGAGVVNAVCNSSNELDIAVWVYGGEAIINGNTFTNEGAGDDDQYDLIYVNNGGKLTINDGTFKCATPKWTLNMGDNSNSEIVVNGGVFYGYNPAEAYTEPNSPVSFVSDEIVCVYINEDGAYALSTEHDYEHDQYTKNENCTEVRTGPTCTEYGFITHTCRCGEYRIATLTDNSNKPLGHTAAAAVQENIKDATCSAAGSYDSVVYCSVCNAEISRETLTIDALPHTEETIPAVDATCTATGLTAGTKCSVCGETLVAQTEVEMLDHNYIPVENEDGSTTYTCQNGCNDSYVINNALVNGEYYLGTDLVVFNNGALSAMGSEFTYTYNVTTSMITTDDEGLFFQVIDGTIFFRGSQPLHTHDVNVLIKEVTDPTCTDKGYTTYICQYCGPLYDDDEVDALGHTGGEATCTELAVCTRCEQPYGELASHTEETIPAVDATCTEAGSTAGVKCSVCNEVLTAPETVDALGHTPGEEVIENEKPATSTEAGSYDKVVYCSVCNVEISRETVTVEPTCKHETTEIIPAVLPAPSNNHTGMTEGLYCLDCETVVVEPTETVAKPSDYNIFGIQNMSLALSNNIAINYNVKTSEGYNDIYMVFVYEGIEYVYTEYTVENSSKIVFKFDKTRPHKMATNVDAYLYSSTANGYVVDTIPGGYSIMKYCQQAIDAYKGKDDVFVKLIYDLVAYGAAVQKYENKNISDAELVTTLMEDAGYALEPTEFVGIENGSSIAYNDVEPTKLWWNDVQLMLGSTTVLYYNFNAPSIEGIKVKVEYSDQIIIFENEDIVSLGNGKYRIEIDTLASTQYVYDVKATFITADGSESSSMTWSINGYLDAAVDAFSGETKELMKALYIYGESIRAYFND